MRRGRISAGDGTARIAVVIDSFMAGGAERVAVEVAAAADRDRFTPFVVATRHGGPLEDVLDSAGVEYHILGRRHGFSPRKLLRAHRLLRTADLIQSHKLGSNIWGALLARTTSVPLVACEPTFSGVRERIRTFGYRWWISPVARCIICPSPIVAESLYHEGVPPERVAVVRNGVRTDAALPRSEARAELQLDPRAFVVGIIARLREEKAHEVLFEALAQLRAGQPDVTVCVVGDGECRATLVSIASELGVADAIVWAGERREAKRLAKAFDVGVIASDYEGLPVAALEILAAGVPMVSTAVGTMPEILSSGAGIVVPVRDSTAMATAIKRFVAEPALTARAGERARDVVVREYGFDAMVRGFEDVYDRALGSRASRR
jgi:glycosyltransferase involved in cell wall biosynthesis